MLTLEKQIKANPKKIAELTEMLKLVSVSTIKNEYLKEPINTHHKPWPWKKV